MGVHAPQADCHQGEDRDGWERLEGQKQVDRIERALRGHLPGRAPGDALNQFKAEVVVDGAKVAGQVGLPATKENDSKKGGKPKASRVKRALRIDAVPEFGQVIGLDGRIQGNEVVLEGKLGQHTAE